MGCMAYTAVCQNVWRKTAAIICVSWFTRVMNLEGLSWALRAQGQRLTEETGTCGLSIWAKLGLPPSMVASGQLGCYRVAEAYKSEYSSKQSRNCNIFSILISKATQGYFYHRLLIPS